MSTVDSETHVQPDSDSALRLRMIHELERFLSGTLPKLDGRRRVVPTAAGSASLSPTCSASPGPACYDSVSRCGEIGPC